MEHAHRLRGVHLRDLLRDDARNDAMFVRAGGITLDFTHQKIDAAALAELVAAAREAGFEPKRRRLLHGGRANEVEHRAALHTALRAARDSVVRVEGGHDVVPDVWAVLDAVSDFVGRVRSGAWRGCTGKPLTDIVSVGIGGSFHGSEVVADALRFEATASAAAAGRRLRFLANVDPVDVRRALDGLSPESTLVVVVSKTFTTAETMLNARTVRQWLLDALGSAACLAKHVVACSTAVDKARDFGIDPANIFGFWDWVGGRFSVWSAVGILPLALLYSFGVVEQLLLGARAMDEHFLAAAPEENLPFLMGILAVWNGSCFGFAASAILPYCQALGRFAAHIQQVEMESNGKSVQADGKDVMVNTAAVYFGEPGTNGQHSFYQMLHQGTRIVPAEFIGFRESQTPIELEGEVVSNHDELMSNFFAQPDALALGLTADEVRNSGVPENLVPHRTFPGDRPSLSLLLPSCDAFHLGQLLALYEHRAVVQGWLWNINSFDQFGVELGKQLGRDVRNFLSAARTSQVYDSSFARPTTRLLADYLERPFAK